MKTNIVVVVVVSYMQCRVQAYYYVDYSSGELSPLQSYKLLFMQEKKIVTHSSVIIDTLPTE